MSSYFDTGGKSEKATKTPEVAAESAAGAPFAKGIYYRLENVRKPADLTSFKSAGIGGHVARIANSDELPKLSNIHRLIPRLIKAAIKEDWYAAPVSLIASVVSALVTACGVVWYSQTIQDQFGSISSLTGNLSVSSFASLVAYLIFLPIHCGLMYICLSRKYRLSNRNLGFSDFILRYGANFTLHATADIWAFFATTATQSGGIAWTHSLFWSIVIGQFFPDVIQAISEPFVWRLSEIARVSVLSNSLEPANIDSFQDAVESERPSHRIVSARKLAGGDIGE